MRASEYSIETLKAFSKYGAHENNDHSQSPIAIDFVLLHDTAMISILSACVSPRRKLWNIYFSDDQSVSWMKGGTREAIFRKAKVVTVLALVIGYLAYSLFTCFPKGVIHDVHIIAVNKIHIIDSLR